MSNIINEKDINYTDKGAKTKEKLEDKPCVYKSDSNNYKDIKKAKNIPEEYTEKLAKINGYFSTSGKNVHLYAYKRWGKDGLNRICHIYKNEKDIKIEEYGPGAKNSPYSSYYKILKSKLNEEENFEEKDTFILTKENINNFVDIVNQIIEDHQSGKYLLKVTDVYECDNKNYHIVYWVDENKLKLPTKNFSIKISISNLYFENEEQLEKEIHSHLINNKHIILTGPPGTGKSKLAKEICNHYVGENEYNMVTPVLIGRLLIL